METCKKIIETIKTTKPFASGEHGNVYDFEDGKILKEIVVLPRTSDLTKETERKKLSAILRTAHALKVGPKFGGIGLCSGKVYYVQEKFPGKFPGPTPKVMRELATLLTHMLKNGLQHNDLSDANLMTNKDGELRLIDFDYGEYVKPKSITNIYEIEEIINRHSILRVGTHEKEYRVPFTDDQRYEIHTGLLVPLKSHFK